MGIPTLFIAAGHGGTDRGNTASGNIEAHETIRFVDGMNAWFQRYGVPASLGGCITLLHNLDLQGQIKAITDWKLTPPDLALDIHLDYRNGSSGALVIYDEHPHGRRFAEAWLRRWCEATGIRNNGAHYGPAVARDWRGWSNFGWCAPRYPGLILELGCINSPSDLAKIRTPMNQALCAQIVWEEWNKVR